MKTERLWTTTMIRNTDRIVLLGQSYCTHDGDVQGESFHRALVVILRNESKSFVV